MEEFSKLVDLMATLRSDRGCPWDKKQTIQAFKTFILEEVYELIEAIEEENYPALREELGDVLFHIVFMAQISKEKGAFDIREVVSHAYEKMYRRHPHVFLDQPAATTIEKRWEEIKREEREDYSLLSNIPHILPALLKAYIIGRRVSRVGFDWDKAEGIYEKINEELAELRAAEETGESSAIREEVGDLLFSVANLARFHGIDPEDALRSTCDKFTRRFNYVEANADTGNAPLSAMDKLWDEAKKLEKKGA